MEDNGGEKMNKITEKFHIKASPVISSILLMIFMFPGFSMATGPNPINVGQAQRIQDAQKLQRALYILLQKAHAQKKVIESWHRRAQLERIRAQAKNRKQDMKAMAGDTSRRNSSYVTAMVGPDYRTK